MKRYTCAAVAVLLVVFPWRQAPTGDQVAYTVEALNTSVSVGGLVPAETGINASGEVVGTVTDPSNGTRAVRYTDGIGWEYVPGLTWGSTAAGVNVYGDIVGTRIVGGLNHAYRYNVATSVVDDILPLPNGTSSAGFAINDNGDIVGQSDVGGGIVRGFVARLGQAPVVLPTLAGTSDQACGINNAGQIAETSADTSGLPFAVRIEADDTTLLNAGTVDGSTPGMSGACAIDDLGHIGGNSSSNGFMAFHAFRWDPGHPVVADAGLPSTFGNVESISAGVSAGWYQVADGTTYALLYTDANGAVDLNTQIAPNSGWVLTRIKGINASGQMVGDGLFNGVATVFRLNLPKSVDTTPPVISNLSVTPSNIAVVNGQLDPVAVSFTATDNSGAAPTCALSISGPGVAGTDYLVTNVNNGSVKAVGGRTYAFTVTCSDASGNSSTGSANVTVATDTTRPVMSPVVANPSTIGPPLGQMVPVTISVSATDDSGVVSCSLASISGGTPGVDSQITGTFTGSVTAVGGRTYTFTAQCTDFSGNSSVGSATVVVPADTTPPVISMVYASPDQIWPPNGKFVPVSVMVTATDNVDATPSCSLTSISGGTGGSSAVTGQYTGSVRADSNAVYVLTVTCSDHAGNKATATATVSVTKVNGNSGTPKVNTPNGKLSSTTASDKDHDGYTDHDRDDRNNRKDGKDRDDRGRGDKDRDR